MLCPKCDGEIETTSIGEAVCVGCGKRWENVLHICGEKCKAAVTNVSKMETIETASDLLAILAEMTNIEAAYSEVIDELTLGAKI